MDKNGLGGLKGTMEGVMDKAQGKIDQGFSAVNDKVSEGFQKASGAVDGAAEKADSAINQGLSNIGLGGGDGYAVPEEPQGAIEEAEAGLAEAQEAEYEEVAEE